MPGSQDIFQAMKHVPDDKTGLGYHMAGKIHRVFGLRKSALSILLAVSLLVPTTGADAARKHHKPHLVVRTATKAPQGFLGICSRYQWACAAEQQTSMSDRNVLRMAQRINRHVNRRVRSISDTRQYNQAEVWALPTRRGGDCEDFALLKKGSVYKSYAWICDRGGEASAG